MNSSLTRLVEDVYALTNRPDRVSETLIAVKNATLKAHSSDYFDKDLLETGIEFDYPNFQQSLEYKSLVPRWRALKYLRKYDASGEGRALDFLTVLTADNLLDSYGANRENICYVAGLQLQIRSNTISQYFLLGCYVYPDVTEDDFCSWIAEECPAAITYKAAATVFKTIGYDEQANAYEALARDEYLSLKTTNIQAVGY